MAMSRMMTNDGSTTPATAEKRAPVAGYLVADEYGRVEGYRAGSRLGQRKQFEKVTACYPAAPVYHLPFDEGYHGEASSEA